MSNFVFVLDTNKQPLEPCSPTIAKKLLKAGKAEVFRQYPFTIILKKAVRPPLRFPQRTQADLARECAPSKHLLIFGASEPSTLDSRKNEMVVRLNLPNPLLNIEMVVLVRVPMLGKPQRESHRKFGWQSAKSH